MLRLFQQAYERPQNIAIIEADRSYTYDELIKSAEKFAGILLGQHNDLHEQRIAFLVDPGFDYVKVQWAIWLAGGVAVPLCVSHPLPSIAYVLEDTGAATLVVSNTYRALLFDYAQTSQIRFIVLGEEESAMPFLLPNVELERRAMILFTSGTTSKPKGVVTTHANLEAQISCLVEAWQWHAGDRTVCVLPLHHVHGIVNVVCCSLWSGASCTFIPSFSADAVFQLFSSGRINVFMAVPTVYHKLMSYWDQCPRTEQQQITASMKGFRLMVCGSAALPVSIMEKWETISGHRLLERYGMTEIGMAISNPYRGDRRTGYIGTPLPGVEVRLVDEAFEAVAPGTPGEIQVKGPGVFTTYWGKAEATQKAFTEDGWFKTGDIAVVENGYYRILGRDSIDIIKSGGYKISALEIEEVLRSHALIKDCAVIGIPNEEWGELVAAVLVTETTLELAELKDWLKERLPNYKSPKVYQLLAELPRNAMGKVVKNELKPLFS